MNAFDRRKLLGLSAAATVGIAAAACTGGSGNTGSDIGQSVADINDLTDQQAKLTIEPYNRITKIPGCKYPADTLRDSLELRNLREKLLRYNQPNKLGYVHLFSYTGLVAVLPVMGKVSSTQSSMTATTAIYQGSSYGTLQAVPSPADDVSWGPNEGGDQGIFFFTPEEVMVVVGGMHWIYLDCLLPGGEALLVYNKDNVKPSSTSADSK